MIWSFLLPERVVGAELTAEGTAAYNLKLRELAHLKEDEEPGLWPAKAVYPNVDALLPFNRIVAYYGNFYSKGMGVLGQYSTDEVIRRLKIEVEAWKTADPTTPVVPAIDYIAVTAQRAPGADGKYRWRMPDSQIQKAITMADQVDGIVILEVQAGLSEVMTEVKELEPYLSLPNVHLAIDPEFAMKKSGSRPGTRVGTVDAVELNAIADYLAGLVKENNLPPKVLVVHRYTKAMVTNSDKITPLPEVQFVMDMDGWGYPAAKRATYHAFIHLYPVQFTGFKLFYRNDTRYAGSRLMTPAEILKLTPQPSFIQYQ
ncbi:MAG: hypothetical protein WC813_02365 [Patescibacteria group bacterium]